MMKTGRLLFGGALAIICVASASPVLGYVVVTAATDRLIYFPMEPVGVNVTATNPYDWDVNLDFSSGFQADFVIDGAFWWSADKFFTQAFTHVDIPAYGSHTWTLYETAEDELLRYPLVLGSHSVIGSVVNYGSSSPVTFDVVTMPGDANLDWRVDVNDLTTVLTNYGKISLKWRDGDFNEDGRVDVNDLTIVLTEYGQTGGIVMGGGAVPEPSVAVLLVAVLVVLAGRAGWTKRR
jgi:hypothetical protein